MIFLRVFMTTTTKQRTSKYNMSSLSSLTHTTCSVLSVEASAVLQTTVATHSLAK